MRANHPRGPELGKGSRALFSGSRGSRGPVLLPNRATALESLTARN